MNSIDIHVRKLALAATGGKWARDHTDVVVDNEHNTLVTNCRCASDAEYIAAVSPEYVMDLIDRLSDYTRSGYG